MKLFTIRLDGGMAVNRVAAAVQSDRAKEDERELQRVLLPFRSAHARGGEKEFLLDPLAYVIRPWAQDH